jgi:aminoglycoside phosphotransferase (APT) family kinase protein
MEALDAGFDDGTSLHLVFKDLSRQSMLEGAQASKPAFLYDPEREIEVYRTALPHGPPGPPTCYGAIVDPRAGRYWLFLENVPGVRLAEVGELAVWEEAARWLARLHSRAGTRGEAATRRLPLIRYDEDYFRRWIRRSLLFLHRGDRGLSTRSRDRFERLAGRYEQVVHGLLALPQTFIHGEFYASNVIVGEAGGTVRICPIDWEMAAMGPSLVDLAALGAGRWSDQDREALAQAYLQALGPGGLKLTDQAFVEAFDLCRLHLAVQWLGWSPDWSPPPEHAHDWLGEALMVAERLRL